MTPTQRAAIVEDLNALIARHRKWPAAVPDMPGSNYIFVPGLGHFPCIKDAMLVESNRAVVRLAEAVLVLLPDADRPDV